MDQMVLKTQAWLNTTYVGYPYWEPIELSGKTGWPTIRGLIRALQIEIGISEPNGNFGPATEKACPTLKKNLESKDEKLNKLVHILQGAMWCKGFSPSGFTGTFGDGTESGVKHFQSFAGLSGEDVNGIVTPMIFKALLNMDAYQLVSSGDAKIREIQQRLNRDYHKWIGLKPTDGRYGRDTNKALIYALQVEEGIAEPNGTFGPSTKALLPTISPGSKQSNFVKIIQYTLYCNRFDPTGFTGTFGNGTLAAVKKFQSFCLLPTTGNIGPLTWASLLVSSGDKNRKGAACDCSSEVTQARAETLKANGYEIVGRYIAGGEWKKLKVHESKIIFKNGLRLVPIYQTAGNSAGYFTPTKGISDAKAAIESALEYGFPFGTTIYFAVDFDAVNDEVTSNILPYFRKIKSEFSRYNPKKYNIGIYGPRNVCTRVGGRTDEGQLLGEGISKTSFVCDMSTGFSGNLGYPLPPDWAFDQIKEYTIGSGDGAIAIDNNICSNRDRGVSRLDSPLSPPDENPDGKPEVPEQKPELTESQKKEVLNFAKGKGLFEGLNADFETFNKKIKIMSSLFPKIKIEGELALTEQFVGPYNSINFYMTSDALTTTFLDKLTNTGVLFDFNRRNLDLTFSKIRITKDINKTVKYYVDFTPKGELVITFEVGMPVPVSLVADQLMIYQRLIITIEPSPAGFENVPVPLYDDKPASSPSSSFVMYLGFAGVAILCCALAPEFVGGTLVGALFGI